MIDIEALVAVIRSSAEEQQAQMIVGNAPEVVLASVRAVEVQIAFARWFSTEVNNGNSGVVYEAAGIAMAQMATGAISLLAENATPGTKRAAMTLMVRAFGNSAMPVLQEIARMDAAMEESKGQTVQ